MSSRRCGFLLFIGLLLLLPLPLQQGLQLPWLAGFKYFSQQPSLALALTLVFFALLIVLVVAVYLYLSRQWPDKVRGALAGISLLILLMLVTSVPVYQLSPQQSQLTLRQWLG